MVQLDSYVSSQLDVTVGVPQGSLLGVLLFQIHINDLIKCLTYSCAILYADDTTIYLAGRSLKYLRSKLQRDLDSLAMWLQMNQLKLNVGKTKVMVFNKEGLTPQVHLEIENEVIECVNSFKFLGVTLDNKLCFDDHYRSLYEKLFKSSYVIKSLAKYFLVIV